MKTSIFIFLLGLILSCQDSQTFIRGCCADPPQGASFGNGKIILPNIFTPNGDGVHDQWIIYGDSAIIKDLSIWNESDILMYHASEMDLNKTALTWNGYYQGHLQTGMFTYRMVAESYDHKIQKLEGRLCSFDCRDQLENSRVNCLFDYFDPPYHTIGEPCFE